MIAAIENAIAARLLAAAVNDVLGYQWASHSTWPDDWSEELMAELGTIRAPAFWVMFAGWSPAPGATVQQPMVLARFAVVVMAENQRNEQATRHGVDATGEVGSYQLAEDVAALLAGQKLALDITPIEIGALRFVRRPEALRRRKCSMLAVELSAVFRLPPSPQPDGDPADFEAFHANWDVPGFGNVGPALPDDAHADATDHVTLETAP